MPKLQVLWAVVVSDTVPVMYGFSLSQWSTKHSLHYAPMLKFVNPTDTSFLVSFTSYVTGAFWASASRQRAIHVNPGVFSGLVRSAEVGRLDPSSATG